MGVDSSSYAWAFLICTAGTGLGFGHLLRRRSNAYKDESFLDQFVLNTSLGLGAISLLLFVLAALRHLHLARDMAVASAAATAACLVCILGLGVLCIRRWLRAGNRPSLPTWKTVLWAIAFICLALLVLIPAMAPPSGSDWDSLAYHLSVPKLFLEHGGFYYIDFMSHSNFPMLVEMLYLPALSMDSPAGAKMVHYLCGVLLVLAVVMLVRKHFSPRAAPIAALAIAGMPIVMWEATTAYIDLATALYTVVAVYLLLEYFDRPELKSLIWCGVAAGFAASTKMTGLAVIPMLVVWLVVDRGMRPHTNPLPQERGQVVKHALTLAGVGLLVCSPWYIKSWIYTGNPVYPFFYSIFGGKDWTHELAQHYTLLQQKFGVGHDFASFALLPWDLTFRSERFYDTPGLFVGPMLLVAVPLLFAARGLSRKLIGLIVFFAAQMAIWFVLTQQSRYLIPAFAILAVIIAAIAYADERFRITRIALYGFFGATALFGVLVMSYTVRDTAPVVFGSETTDHYLSRTLPVYDAQKWINENTGNANVALFGDTRGFYLGREYVWADWGHNKRFTRRFASVDEFVSYLKEQGITHAMVNFRFLPDEESATGTAQRIYEAVAEGRFEQVGDKGATSVGVYRIR